MMKDLKPCHNCTLFQIKGELALKMENTNDIERIALTDTAPHENSIHQILSSLPDELLMKIVGLLPHSDLSVMLIVNKKFNNLVNDPSLWKKYPVPSIEIVERYGYHTLKFLNFQSLESWNVWI